MAGDPQQLPPTVTSDEGMKAGLDITLFERLAVSSYYQAISILSFSMPIDCLSLLDCMKSGQSYGDDTLIPGTPHYPFSNFSLFAA